MNLLADSFADKHPGWDFAEGVAVLLFLAFVFWLLRRD